MYHVPLPAHLANPRKVMVQPAADPSLAGFDPATFDGKRNSDTPTSSAPSAPPSVYPNMLTPLQSTQQKAAAPQQSASEPDGDGPPSDPNIKFLRVTVTPADSVIGVAARYGVSEAQLRQYNRKLIWDYCEFVDHVWVPLTAEASGVVPPREDASRAESDKYMKKKAFIARTGCEAVEADFYLEENNWVLDKALTAYGEDVAWEQGKDKQAVPASGKPAYLPTGSQSQLSSSSSRSDLNTPLVRNPY